MKRLVILGTLGVFAADAAAQEVNLATTTTERPHLVRVRTGLDHAFTAQLGYDHVVAPCDRVLIAGVEITLPWAHPDLGDYQVRLGATTPLVEHGPWKLAGRLGPTVRGAGTAAGRMTALGAELGLSAGYHGDRGFVAAEAAADWAAATHVRHSDAYRDGIYADADDGWYRSTGGTIRAGVHGGVSFRGVDLVLRVGRPFAIDLEGQTLPFYATVGVNVAR